MNAFSFLRRQPASRHSYSYPFGPATTLAITCYILTDAIDTLRATTQHQKIACVQSS